VVPASDRKNQRPDIMNTTTQKSHPDTREQWVDVTVQADPARHVVSITGSDGHEHEYFADDAREVALAAQHTRGRGQWCAKYSRLLVPGASRVTGGVSFYKLEPLPA